MLHFADRQQNTGRHRRQEEYLTKPARGDRVRGMKTEILDLVVERAGSVDRLATELGITREAVYVWTAVPWRHAPAVSRLTGIPEEELRPKPKPRVPKPKRNRARAKAAP